MKYPFVLPLLQSYVASTPGSFGNLGLESWEAEWRASPKKGDNSSIDLLVGGRPVRMLSGQLADRLCLSHNCWLFPMFYKRRGTHSRQGNYWFSHRRWHVASRGRAQAGAMFVGLSLAFSQRPGLFWQPPQLCRLCWECFLNCSVQTPILATQSPGLVYRPKSGNEGPLRMVVGFRRLCHKLRGEGKGRTPRLLFLHRVWARKVEFRL